MNKWITIKSDIALDTSWITVSKNSFQIPGGALIPEYYIIQQNDSAVCPCFVDGRFVLVKQYRPGVEKFVICHPGGRVDSDDKNPLAAASRELIEETGCVAKATIPLGSFAQIPAISTGRVHMFLVFCDRLTPELSCPEESEQVSVLLKTPEELLAHIESGDMDCAACVCATYRALEYINKSAVI